MRKRKIDILFPIVLLFSFLLCAIMLLTVFSNTYTSIINDLQENSTEQIALSYIQEKIKQSNETIEIIQKDNMDCIALNTTINNIKYQTLIYKLDDELMELFTKENSDISLDNGTKIMQISNFEIDSYKNDLYKITVNNANIIVNGGLLYEETN